MAFNQQEQELIRWGAQNGKSREEIEQAIIKLRTGVAPQPAQEVTAPSPSGFDRSVESVSGAMQTADDVRGRVAAGEQSPVSGTLETIGGGLRAGAEVIGNAVLGVGKFLLPKPAEEAIAGGVKGAAEAVVQTEPAQALIERYNSLSPDAKGVVDGLLGVTEGLATMVGAGPAVSAAKTAAKAGVSTAQKGMTAAETALAPAVATARQAPEKAVSWVAEPRKASVDTVLKETPVERFDQYVDTARKATVNNKNQTPLEFAGIKAQEALDQMNRKLDAVGQAKSQVLQSAAGRTPVGNIVVKFRQQLQNALKNKTSVEGDAKIYQDILAQAEKIGNNPTALQVDRFVDFVQDRIYTGKRDLVTPVTDDVQATLRPLTGQLNEALKTKLPESYRNLNAKYAQMVGTRNELNLKLGMEGEKGGSLMKRVFSPSDAGTKQLFADVLKETGIDLVNEATLARFVMDVLGDARQKSMLEQLNLQLTNPTSGMLEKILNYTLDKTVNSPDAQVNRARQLTVGGAPVSP